MAQQLQSLFQAHGLIEYANAFLEAKCLPEDLPYLSDAKLEKLIPDEIPRSRLKRIIQSGIGFHSAPAAPFPNLCLQNKLGAGAFGAVFRAVDHNNEAVAVKRFRRTFTHANGSVENLKQDYAQQEVENASRLISVKNANIVRVRHVVNDPGDDQFFRTNALVMEFCSRGTLFDLIGAHKGSFSVLEVINIALHMLEGVAALHTSQLVHRDIAPRNIFATEDALGRLVFKVGDYGHCVFLANADSAATRAKYSIHTPPETKLTFVSDVVGVAITLFEVMRHQPLDVVGSHDVLERERDNVRHLLNTPAFRTPYTVVVDIVLQMLEESPVKRLSVNDAILAFRRIDTSGALFLFCIS